jgi:hypothetical protein
VRYPVWITFSQPLNGRIPDNETFLALVKDRINTKRPQYMSTHSPTQRPNRSSSTKGAFPSRNANGGEFAHYSGDPDMPPCLVAEILETRWRGREYQWFVVHERDVLPRANRGYQERHASGLANRPAIKSNEPFVIQKY